MLIQGMGEKGYREGAEKMQLHRGAQRSHRDARRECKKCGCREGTEALQRNTEKCKMQLHGGIEVHCWMLITVT